MKNKNMLRKVVYMIVSTSIICLILSLLSCDHAKQAQRGWNKFVKHGGTVDTLYKVDSVPKLILINGKDSIIYEILYFKEPVINFPKPNIQIRQEERTKRLKAKQQGKTERKETTVQSKVDKVQIRNDRKQNNVETRQANRKMSFFDWLMIISTACFAFWMGRFYEQKLN